MAQLINFKKRTDIRGSLIPIEGYKDVPFNIERIFYIKDMDKLPRGFHAHKKSIQVLIPLTGSFDIELTDSFEIFNYHLNKDDQGLLVPVNMWLKMENYSSDCIILIICSYEYDENEYIRNFGDFIKHQQERKESIKIVDLSEQHNNPKLMGEIHRKMKEIINNNNFVLGSELELFEKRFAEYNNSNYCVGLSNGTAAIICALKALNLEPCSEIIVQSNTYIAAPLAIEACGHKIKIVDIDCNLNMNLDLLENALTQSTKVVLIVHLYGGSPDMYRLLELKRKWGFYLIEDAAQAHGSTFDGKKLGTFGDIGCFSFYPTKNLGCFGEGGCIITDNKNHYNYIKKYRNYGSEEKYIWELKGCNERMHNIQASILNVKLEYLDMWNNKRRLLAEIYNKLLKNINEITIIQDHPLLNRNYHLYVILVDRRTELMKYLAENNIQTTIHYPQTFYKSSAFVELNNNTFLADNNKHKLLTLPLYPELTEQTAQYICEKIKMFYTC